jgi:aryl-alcohol dehydrogenase-like predicted oxidoreductase
MTGQLQRVPRPARVNVQPMDTVILGRTGLETSVAGLGCGGHSRLGQAVGLSENESVGIVKRAIDLGVTFIDTARVYGTERVVGKGIEGRRDEVVLSTKALPSDQKGQLDGARLRKTAEKSLTELGTENVDVFHLHGVADDRYDHCVEVLVPEMLKLRDEGKIRFLAISEQFGRDTGHKMVSRAINDDIWDVMMVGFNFLNPSARKGVFPTTISKDIGVLVMFAVRRVLSQPDELRRVLDELVSEGRVSKDDLDLEDPLGFLVSGGGASSIVEAAYRFTRHEPGTHVVLTGTGNVDHLEQNIASIGKGPLPQRDLEKLEELFGHLDHLSGN